MFRLDLTRISYLGGAKALPQARRDPIWTISRCPDRVLMHEFSVLAKRGMRSRLWVLHSNAMGGKVRSSFESRNNDHRRI
eukprot:3979519-Pleurochrysis_carterae.AAC.1